jgi:Na+-driven multidrug efflux pump
MDESLTAGAADVGFPADVIDPGFEQLYEPPSVGGRASLNMSNINYNDADDTINNNDDDDNDDVDDDDNVHEGCCGLANARSIFNIAAPALVNALCEVTLPLVNIMFVGHLNPDFLAAAALGNMFTNITGISVCFGLSSAVDTLASQSFGAKRYKYIGVLMQRQIAFTFCVAFVPIVLLWLYAEPLLVAASQQRHIARLSGEYIFWMLPGLPPIILYDIISRTFQAQKIVMPFVYIGCAINLINIGLCYVYIHVLDLGFYGAPLATSTCNWLFLISSIVYIRWNELHKLTWGGVDVVAAFSNWGGIARLALPGMGMVSCVCANDVSCVETMFPVLPQCLIASLSLTQNLTIDLCATCNSLSLSFSL